MNNLELIKTRRSVRTFDGKPLSEEDKNKLLEFAKNIPNPYNIPVEFIYLDAKEHGLSSPVIAGENEYFAAKVKYGEHSEEAFGYSFEKFVLYAWSLGIGTTWIGGTMKRELFEREAGVGEDERMYCITPVGYPAKKKSIKEIAMRTGVRADSRKDAKDLFFENDFATPLSHVEDTVKNALEAVRLGPSAVNKQPWRIVKCGNSYHFYVRHDKGYSEHPTGDIQVVDMGIALCHFMDFAGGELSINDPGIKVPEDCIEYIATVTI